MTKHDPQGYDATDGWLEPWRVVSVGLPLLAVTLSRMQVGDLAYHVRAGSWMWSVRALLRRDLFTFTMYGEPWLNQQWGAQLLLSCLYGVAGWRGMIGFRALIVAGCFAAVFGMARRAGADPLVAGVLSMGAFAVVAMAPGALAMRPQLLVLPFFLIVLWLLRNRDEYPGRLWWIVLLSAMWANMHGSFLLAPFLCMMALIEDHLQHRQVSTHTVTVAGLSLLAGLFTPWGIATYRYVLDVSTHPLIRERIGEWKPLWMQWPAGIGFVLSVAAIAVVLKRHRARARSMWGLLTLSSLGLLALSGSRHLIWWALAMPLLVASLIDSGWSPGSKPSRGVKLALLGTIGMSLVLGVIRVATTEPIEALLEEAPPGLTRSISDATDAGDRLFNGWWGSWFEYATPEIQVFIDSRMEFFDSRTWAEYFQVVRAKPGWAGVLKKWDVDIVAVSGERHPLLIEALVADHRWRLHFRDDDGAVFLPAKSDP